MIDCFIISRNIESRFQRNGADAMQGKNRKFFAVVFLGGLFALTSWAVEYGKVNGKSITDKEMKAALSGMGDSQRNAILSDPQSRRQVFDNVVTQDLLISEAEKSKVEQSTEFKDAMSNFKRQLMVNAMIDRATSGKLGDSAMKKFYEANKIKYNTDRVHVAHILVNDELQAKDILKKASEKGADFAKLAEQYSKDPSAKNNRGDLGFIGHDSAFIEEFKDAAFSGKTGELVGPLKTTFGYHIIKVIESKPGKLMTYDEVEARVRNDLRQQLIQTYIQNLRKDAKITVDAKAFK